MTKPFSYNFADYLDLLNERFKSIRIMVTNLHNEQVTNRHAVHGEESLTLRDFHEGDIVYCYFPSKSLIGELGIQSWKNYIILLFLRQLTDDTIPLIKEV